MIVTASGDYGKPHPALIVQSDIFAELPSLVICPVSPTLRSDTDLFRLEVSPSARNGLRKSQSRKSLPFRPLKLEASPGRTGACLCASTARSRSLLSAHALAACKRKRLSAGRTARHTNLA
jgi:mRNA-degrading endonuclease toxin of MazEF toxin-antitoxin module